MQNEKSLLSHTWNIQIKIKIEKTNYMQNLPENCQWLTPNRDSSWVAKLQHKQNIQRHFLFFFVAALLSRLLISSFVCLLACLFCIFRSPASIFWIMNILRRSHYGDYWSMRCSCKVYENVLWHFGFSFCCCFQQWGFKLQRAEEMYISHESEFVERWAYAFIVFLIFGYRIVDVTEV